MYVKCALNLGTVHNFIVIRVHVFMNAGACSYEHIFCPGF